MPINSFNPVTVPGTAERQYPKLWLWSFSSFAGYPTGDRARLSTELRYYRQDEAGKMEFAPFRQDDATDPAAPIKWVDGNVFTLHQRRPDIDAAIGQVLDNVALIRANAPSNVLAVLEIIAQAAGLASQIPAPEPEPQPEPPPVETGDGTFPVNG